MAGLPVDRIRGLGGQLGEKVKAQGCETVGDLAAKSEAWCQKSFGEKTGRWLFRMARGLDDEPVKDRPLSLSVSNGKTFRGAQVIDDAAAGCDWLAIMVGEINSRVEQMARQHQRAPKTLTLTIQSSRATNTTGAVSRSVRYRPGGAEALRLDAQKLLRTWASAQPGPLGIRGLLLNASQFEPVPAAAGSSAVLKSFLSAGAGGGAAPVGPPPPPASPRGKRKESDGLLKFLSAKTEEAAAEAPPPGGRGQGVGEAGEGGGPPAAAAHPGPGGPASPTTFAYESTEIDIFVLNALPASLATEVRMSMLASGNSAGAGNRKAGPAPRPAKAGGIGRFFRRQGE